MVTNISSWRMKSALSNVVSLTLPEISQSVDQQTLCGCKIVNVCPGKHNWKFLIYDFFKTKGKKKPAKMLNNKLDVVLSDSGIDGFLSLYLQWLNVGSGASSEVFQSFPMIDKIILTS